MDDQGAIEQTAEIISAFVSNNAIGLADLPALIQSVHKTLVAIGSGEPEPEGPKAPAVPPRRSVQPDHIVCLEDGRKFKSMKRHLRTDHNLTPDLYRAKWNLDRSYPMVAPNYSEARSALAKSMGLGAAGRKAPAVVKTPRKRAAKAPASTTSG
jgi:predicted transcriptional regulator